MPKITKKEKKLQKLQKPHFVIGYVTKKEVLLFTKNLSILLKTGSTMSEALRVLEGQTKGKFKTVLSEIIERTQKGHQLSEALNHYPRIFSSIYRNIVRIGEKSGTLEENLNYLNTQLTKKKELRRSIRSSMMYPLMVLVGTLFLGFTVTIFVLPKLARLFKSFHIDLPLSTRMLLALSDFFQNYGIWAFLLIIVTVVGLILLLRLRIMKPLIHWSFLHIPVIKNISVHVNLAMFCRTLSILLKSGITIDDGLKTCSETMLNVHYARYIVYAHERVQKGDTLTSILKKKKRLFPDTDTQIMHVGETSGTLTESLEYCASIHEEEVHNLTKDISTIIEPIVLLVLGIMVAVLALAIITPIYSITNEFRR